MEWEKRDTHLHYSVEGPGHVLVYGKSGSNRPPKRQVWKWPARNVKQGSPLRQRMRVRFGSDAPHSGTKGWYSSRHAWIVDHLFLLRRAGIHSFPRGFCSKFSLSTVSEMRVPHQTNARDTAPQSRPPGHVITRVGGGREGENICARGQDPWRGTCLTKCHTRPRAQTRRTNE